MRHLGAVMAALCLVSAGCEADFNNDSNGNQGPLTVQSSSMRDYVEARVVPSEEPEKYFVYFGWPRIEDQKRIRIRTDRQLALVEPSQVSFSHKAEHNQTLTYFFEILDDANRIERSFSKLVVIPRDFVVREGQSSFNDNIRLKVQRLFLSNEPLITNGYDVEIITDEIHSEDGHIDTFGENATAAKDHNGTSGGKLTIRSRVATGALEITMHGQNGGDGSDGAPWEHRAQDGAEAKLGEFRCVGSPMSADRVCDCKSFGARGGDGAPGATGRDGGNAGSGGNTGTLRVEIIDGREFGLRVSKTVGLPGKFGLASDGQDGGIGGKAERATCGGAGGSNGAKGPRGKDGLPASAGIEEPLCVYISSEARNECL